MIRILAVDDMLQWRNYHKNALNFVLQDIEYELELANCAKEAFEKITQNIQKPYDLIITDLQMEEDFDMEYAGEWLIRNTQNLKQYLTVPKIIVSAAPNIKHIASQLNIDFIPKPTLIHNPLTYELKIKEALNLLN